MKVADEEKLRQLIVRLNGPPRIVSKDDYTGPIVFRDTKEDMDEAFRLFGGGKL